MTKEEALHLQIKPRFIEFLKVAGMPFWEPALTVCPYCGEHAGIFSGFRWSCPHCNKHGDVVDYVMTIEHFKTKMAAIKRICRALQIKITTLEVISADELLDKQFENTGALINGFIGRGVYLLAGSPKIGKSWLVLWLAHKVCLGEDVWEFESHKADVLYISLEDSESRIQSRLAAISYGESGNIWFATEAELLGNGFEEQIVSFLNEHPKVKFVIVDTLQKVRQLHHDQYSYAGDYDIISRMKLLADRFGISVLLVHHTRKAEADDPFAMISGTTGLSGSVDGSMVLIKDDRMDRQAKLYVTGRDVLDVQINLVFDTQSCTWKFLGYGEKDQIQKRNRLLSAVNDLLTDIGSFRGTASELMALLSMRSDVIIKSPNALTRQLNPHKSLLQYEYGISYELDRTGKERTVHLKKRLDDDSSLT